MKAGKHVLSLPFDKGEIKRGSKDISQQIMNEK